MRKIVLSAVVATVAALSLAAPSKAGDISIGFGFGNGTTTHTLYQTRFAMLARIPLIHTIQNNIFLMNSMNGPFGQNI